MELSWWVAALSAPPILLAVVSLFIPTALLIHMLAVIPSAVLVWVIARVSIRVESQNMQSVWISLAYGVWTLFPITYIAAIISR